MNDRFRFRAWHLPTKKLFDVYCFTNEHVFENTLDGIGTSPTNPANLTNCVLEQCTGLKDKNGKLIYEGDIVKFKISSIKCVGAVRWDERTGGWLKDKTGQPLHTYIKSVEVIGNIHENPELLEWK